MSHDRMYFAMLRRGHCACPDCREEDAAFAPRFLLRCASDPAHVSELVPGFVVCQDHKSWVETEVFGAHFPMYQRMLASRIVIDRAASAVEFIEVCL